MDLVEGKILRRKGDGVGLDEILSELVLITTELRIYPGILKKYLQDIDSYNLMTGVRIRSPIP